jgi:hypothetical protein
MKSQLGVAIVVLSVIASHAEVIKGVDIDFVQVGDPGNAASIGLGYGAVDYTYSIGTYEISINQFEAARVQDGRIGNNNESHWVGDLGGAAPASNVSYHEAAKFCNFLTTGDALFGAYNINGGKVIDIDRTQAVLDYGRVFVLPTADEWYKAAYYTGSGYSLYANGTDTAPVNGSEAIYSSSFPWLTTNGAVEVNQQTYNMMGNVWEHTETLDATGTNVLYFGGAISHGTERMHANVVSFDSYDDENTVVGFRVASIPEPGTMSLMGLSTIGLFFTRSVRRRKRMGKAVKPVQELAYCDAFLSREEWLQAQSHHEPVDNGVNEFLSTVLSSAVICFERIVGVYRKLDKTFWDWMVARYERKNERRKNRKGRVLHLVDAILEKIMK